MFAARPAAGSQPVDVEIDTQGPAQPVLARNGERGSELAEFDEAVAVFRRGYPESASSRFAKIAERPRHLRFGAALPWLVYLGERAADPALAAAPIERYGEAHFAAFAKTEVPQRVAALSHLRGLAAYRRGNGRAALELFARVPPDDRLYARARIFTAMIHVRGKKAVPAVLALRDAEAGLGQGPKNERARLGDFIALSLARIYHAAAFAPGAAGALSIDARTINAALYHYDRVSLLGEYAAEALFERAWTHFLIGQRNRGLGDLHALRGPFFEGDYDPQAELLHGLFYAELCKYDLAVSSMARATLAYARLESELARKLQSPDEDASEASSRLDRALERDPDYARARKRLGRLDIEARRLEREPIAFRRLRLGVDLQRSIQQARNEAWLDSLDARRRHYETRLREVKNLASDTARALQAIAAGARSALDLHLYHWSFGPSSTRVVVVADEEHTLWPFDGEYWRDEQGAYRAVLYPGCTF